MTDFKHVEEQIARLRDYQYGCSAQSADEIADTMQALLDENEHKERLLGQVWNIARDNHLEYRARIESIMAAIREKPVAKLQEQNDE